MSGNLDRQIGELSGALSQLAPALENMEKELRDQGKQITALETNYKNMAKDFYAFKNSAEKKTWEITKQVLVVVISIVGAWIAVRLGLK